MSFNQLHHLDQLPPNLGPQLIVDSLSVVFASGYSLPIVLSNDTNYGVAGANTLRTAAQIGNATGAASFGSGASSAQTLLVMLSSDSSVAVSSSALPTGASTEATLSTLNSKVVTTANGIKVDGSAVTQPISGSVSVSASALPTGASTEATLSTLNSKVPANLTVTATRLLVDNSGVTQPISGSISVSNFPATQPVSALSLPLPTGASTESTLSTLSTTATALNTKFANDFGLSSGAIRIASQIGNAAGSADFNAGAATAQTLRVALANGATVTTTPISVPYVTSTDTLHGAIPVTTGTWVQLIASTSAIINRLTCFSSSGSVLELGIGAAGSESRTLLLPPGGFDATVLLTIPASTRISVRAVDVNATSGELQFNFLG